MVSTMLCPKGHPSTEPDYCSECGARMESAESLAPPAAAAAEHCPACGVLREPPDAVFCEICGYNFIDGTASSEPPPVAAPSPPIQQMPEPPDMPAPHAPADPQPAPAAARQWFAVVSVDPQPHGPGSPEPPPDVAAFTIPLAPGTSSLIGRRSTARAIFPEVDLSHDTAVSHRHALLQRDPSGQLLLRDIGSSNGTLRNGQPVTPLVDVVLAPGDVLLLGHWSRLVIQADEAQP